jgi:DNA-binding SARP family transcriptional activator
MLRVRLLGELSLEFDGEPIRAPASRPARSVLGWLALNPGMHRRAQLAARLWPDVLDASARASLRTALHALRAALGDRTGSALRATREEVGLDAEVWVDVRAFAALAADGSYADALELHGGELLAGLDDDWVWDARDRHREALADVRERLAEAAERSGDLAAAVRLTREQVELDPLSEARSRALIERLWRAGDRAAAAATYGRLAERLRTELRVAPSAQTRALLDRLREEEPGDASSSRAGARDDGPLPLPAVLSRTRRSSFIGRAPELERLSAAYDAALRGERRLVVLAGEPGIGKTRLLREFSRTAHERGATVLYGRCLEEPLAPYGPFVAALRPFAAQLPGQLTGSAPAGAPAEGARWRLFEAVDALVTEIARRGPLLMGLDDLHWADRPTLALLAHVLRSPEPAALLVLGTRRSAELERTHPLVSALADLRADELAERIELRGLDRDEVGALMNDWLDDREPGTLDRALYDETEGNPFFVEELLRNYTESGTFGAVPETVKDVITRRIARLGDEAHGVLSAAAVAGREFELALLEALPELAGADALRALEAAMAAQMVREDPSVPGRYDFAHALFRQTLYEELSAARRVRLHCSIAAALQTRHGGAIAPHLGELALHLLEGRDERGAQAAVQAAREASAKLAYEDAAAWYERALAAPGADGGDGELLLALGDSRQRTGEAAAAREAFARAAAVARDRADSELLGRAALGFSGLGVTIITVEEASVALLREALAALPDDGALTAQIVGRLAVETYYATAPAERKALGDRAVALARASGDDRALADALAARHVALWSAAYLDERLATATEMIALAQRIGDAERTLQGHNWRVLDLAELGDIDEMRREIERHEALADALRLPAYQWWGPMWRSTLALLEGRIDEAERLVDEFAAIGRRAQDANAALYEEIQGHGVFIERDAFAAIEDEMLERQIGGPAEAAYRCGYAWIFAARGDDDRAREMLDWIAADDFARLSDDMNRLAALSEMANAMSLLGDARHAPGTYERLAPYAERNVINARAAYGYGAASHHLGVLAALLGDDARAVAHLEDAVQMNERMGAQPWLARSQQELAKLRT